MKNRHSALFRPYHLPLRRTARTRQQICSPCTGPSGSVWLSPRRYHPLFVTRQTRCRTYCPSNRRNSTISPRFGGCVHFTSRTASRPWMRNGAILLPNTGISITPPASVSERIAPMYARSPAASISMRAGGRSPPRSRGTAPHTGSRPLLPI